MSTRQYQTLSDFLFNPFHSRNTVEKDVTYNNKYNEFVSTNKIKIHAITVLEDSYYYHIKVPSESQKDNNYNYDVIIRFFPEDSLASEQSHLRNYKIQFFSNSPSFMYQYAYVYKKNGYLIEALYDKLDADYIDTPPDKTNANQVISYDKSIYFACRYLSEGKFKYLEKNGLIKMKRVEPNKFFSGISDFKSIKLDQALMIEERKLKKGIDAKKKESKERKLSTSKSKSNVTSVTIVKKKGSKPKITRNTKITGKKKK